MKNTLIIIFFIAGYFIGGTVQYLFDEPTLVYPVLSCKEDQIITEFCNDEYKLCEKRCTDVSLRYNKDSDVDALVFDPKPAQFVEFLSTENELLASVNLETGEVTLKGDPNEAAKVFWKAVTSNHPECLKGENNAN